jgi:hypothetical protein
MAKETSSDIIESTAGEVAGELARRGVRPDQRVTVAVEPVDPDDWISKARAYSRPKVVAEGWSDADIDRIIKEERKALQPQNG